MFNYTCKCCRTCARYGVYCDKDFCESQIKYAKSNNELPYCECYKKRKGTVLDDTKAVTCEVYDM